VDETTIIMTAKPPKLPNLYATRGGRRRCDWDIGYRNGRSEVSAVLEDQCSFLLLVTANNSRSPQFLALEISVNLWLMNTIAHITILIPKQKPYREDSCSGPTQIVQDGQCLLEAERHVI